MNREGVKSGLVTAKELQQYCATHDIRRPVASKSFKSAPARIPQDITFGLSTRSVCSVDRLRIIKQYLPGEIKLCRYHTNLRKHVAHIPTALRRKVYLSPSFYHFMLQFMENNAQVYCYKNKKKITCMLSHKN